jgi:RNA polymerase sigma-70 factor (ECF subfamily)
MHPFVEHLYKTYHQDVFQFLMYMVKDRDLSEDLMQEVFVRVIKSHPQFKGKSSEKTWLFSIARNVSIDHFRKNKKWKQKMVDDLDRMMLSAEGTDHIPEDITIEKEEIRVLYQLLDECTNDQKMVLVMRFIQDLSIKETAVALKWSESKVKTTQHRAMKLLKKKLNEKRVKETL